MLEHLLTTRAYWEGHWVDLWSVPHTLFGFVTALSAALLGASAAATYGATATLALAWEFIERTTGLASTEAVTNSLTDIAVALVGFAVGAVLLRFVKNRQARLAILGAGCAVWIVVEILGWLAYRHYAASMV